MYTTSVVMICDDIAMLSGVFPRLKSANRLEGFLDRISGPVTKVILQVG